MKPRKRIANCLMVIVILFLLVGFKAHSTSSLIVVNTTEDEFGNGDHCSLREAIQAINLHADFDECTFPLGPSNYEIELGSNIYSLSLPGVEDGNAGGDLDIKPHAGDYIYINGSTNGATEINGSDIDRVLDVFAASESQVAINDLRVTNGSAYNIGGGIRNSGNLYLNVVEVDSNHVYAFQAFSPTQGGGGIFNSGELHADTLLVDVNTLADGSWASEGSGGGIYNTGTLWLEESIIENNHASDFNDSTHAGTGGRGGGIYTSGAGAAVVILTSEISINSSGDCVATLNNNQCRGGSGGGIYIYSGELTLENSTISGNITGDSLGWWFIEGGGIYNGGTLSVADSTIAYNIIGTGSSSNNGGGIYNYSAASATLRNSILAFNESHGTDGDDCGSALTSQDYNLINDIGGCSLDGTTTHNLPNNTDPQLYPLDYAGGNGTNVHFLKWNSPAIDHGIPISSNPEVPGCPANDQRDIYRPIDGNFDGSEDCDIGAVEADWAAYLFLPLLIK